MRAGGLNFLGKRVFVNIITNLSNPVIRGQIRSRGQIRHIQGYTAPVGDMRKAINREVQRGKLTRV